MVCEGLVFQRPDKCSGVLTGHRAHKGHDHLGPPSRAVPKVNLRHTGRTQVLLLAHLDLRLTSTRSDHSGQLYPRIGGALAMEQVLRWILLAAAVGLIVQTARPHFRYGDWLDPSPTVEIFGVPILFGAGSIRDGQRSAEFEILLNYYIDMRCPERVRDTH